MNILKPIRKTRTAGLAPAWTADAQDTAFMLSCHKRTVHRLVARGVIPCYRVGRNLWFDPAQVFEALAQNNASEQE